MRNLAKRLVAVLPWKMRKLVMFFAEHGLVDPPPFSGVYASFGAVLGTMKAAEDNMVEAATRGISRAPRFDESTKLPHLRRAHSLMPLVTALLANQQQAGQPFRILDFGGAAGVDFANLLAALRATADIRYRVIDLPKVCVVGRARWQHDTRISFDHTLPASAEFDLVYGWSSIQYVPEPLELLTRFASYSPKAILLAGSHFTAGKAFVRAQVNLPVPFPQWVLNLADVERRMSECGYRLAYHVAGDEDYNVDNYPPAYRVPNSASLLFLKSR
jgi:putative methyltransferase (TIGR04325 family)